MERQAFGLAFDIERTRSSASGYQPAQFDLGAGKELFGRLRLHGFAAALRTKSISHLTIVGGDEGRYKNDNPVNRAFAIREMLVVDCGLDPSLVSYQGSNSNTLGNVDIIKARVASVRDIVITSHYHCPRAAHDIAKAGLANQLVAAEAFLLLEEPRRKEDLIEQLGGGPLAERCAEEIQGIADKLRGSYASRTDAAPTTFGQPVRA